MSFTKISAIALLMGCAFLADAKAEGMMPITNFSSCMDAAAKDFANCNCTCGCDDVKKEGSCYSKCGGAFADATTRCVDKYHPTPTKK